MSKGAIGILFICAGLAYGSLSIDLVNKATIGFLVENNWIKSPIFNKVDKNLLGPKPTIILYSIILISLGIFMLITPN